jgi:hypothetical protein
MPSKDIKIVAEIAEKTAENLKQWLADYEKRMDATREKSGQPPDLKEMATASLVLRRLLDVARTYEKMTGEEANGGSAIIDREAFRELLRSKRKNGDDRG